MRSSAAHPEPWQKPISRGRRKCSAMPWYATNRTPNRNVHGLMSGHFRSISVKLELHPRYKVRIQAWLLLQQTEHGTDEAQRTTAAPVRPHPTQPGRGLREIGRASCRERV